MNNPNKSSRSNPTPAMSPDPMAWWSSLHHGGMLLDLPRLSQLLQCSDKIEPLSHYAQDQLRRSLLNFADDQESHRASLIKTVLESVCGFHAMSGHWKRGPDVGPTWARTALTGETLKPSHLWQGASGAVLPVFIDKEKRIGVGRGARSVSHALQWMRKADQALSLITNGEQFRILFAGLSYEAFVEWDQRQWLSAGEPTAELLGLRKLLNPITLTPHQSGAASPFLDAINDSRKGQGELTEILGERVRQAAELLVQGHSQAIAEKIAQGRFTSQELYRASVRMIMRLVIVLFAESRDALLPRDNPIYFHSYSLAGLREQLERTQSTRLRNGFSAYPRILSLCQLIYYGSSHESLLVRAYGGQLFEPGDANSSDGQSRALALLESGCYEFDLMNDQLVHQILQLLSRTKVRVRQGRLNTWVAAPVDFSALESEYIGILYEGLLDFELRQAGPEQPVVFLNVGNQPALPLATLEAMDDRALKNLLESMKDSSDTPDASDASDTSDASGTDSSDTSDEVPESFEPVESDDSADAPSVSEAPELSELSDHSDSSGTSDSSENADINNAADSGAISPRVRAHLWARRAVEVGGLVPRPRGTRASSLSEYQTAVDRKANQLMSRVIQPGEWYLVRWGGTRKGSGTFYTKPQLAIPTVVRTLEPLAYVELPTTTPSNAAGLEPKGFTSSMPGEYLQNPNSEHRHIGIEQTKPVEVASYLPGSQGARTELVPRMPEEILSLKVCDPACGSGTFPLNAMRYLTEALYESLLYHKRFQYYADRTVIDLIIDTQSHQTLADEKLPCRPEDNDFEARIKAVLRRYVVERCIYGVDLDPLAIELCRLSLWIETLDPRLPFTFLDHKIKCGNSLVGTWFDQFMHYPAMAWMREGGDKTHTNGVHFKKDSWTKAISSRLGDVKNKLIDFIDQQEYLNTGEDLDQVQTLHDDAEKALSKIHGMGVHEAQQRAMEYQQLRRSESFEKAKFSLDLWCAIWFWPPELIERCPLPNEFHAGQLPNDAAELVRQVASQLRFFHWQLEFPDVFSKTEDGFDAIVGNPPWDIAKPNSKEFFSALDPLYRSYGKQEAIRKQNEAFAQSIEVERRWLNYNAQFRALSNWVKHSGAPYGNTVSRDGNGKESQDLNIGGGGGGSLQRSVRRHVKWKENREALSGYSQELEDVRGFHHQGSGDINLYKMFLEQAYALMRNDGRMGFIVPSGIYSDHGTGTLRALFLERCRWEWLFGFENREGIFDIHRSFKFNPIVIQKGGTTGVIRTAFMRRDLRDWERAEEVATGYPRERVLQFSPKSKAILEIQSQRDLEVLEKIYSNGVLLGDSSPQGWGIRYSTEFHMTSDSKLFPPRDKWEERGYRPDEYSRWLRGDWRAIEELYSELGVRALPEGERREVQPIYAHLPIPRADIPAGIILSRDGRSYIRESGIDTDEFLDKRGERITGPAIALPLYQGVMIGGNEHSAKRWIHGTGLSASWDAPDMENKSVSPQYLIAAIFNDSRITKDLRFSFRDIARTTDTRTMIGSLVTQAACGNTVPVLSSPQIAIVAASLQSFCYDWITRIRMGGTHLNYYVIDETSIISPRSFGLEELIVRTASLTMNSVRYSAEWLKLQPYLGSTAWRTTWAMTRLQRLKLNCILDSVVAMCFGLSKEDYAWILQSCDLPAIDRGQSPGELLPKGFWRVDREESPPRRQSTLSLLAYYDLCETNGGLQGFLAQNDGEGWEIPERVRLSDYGLGGEAGKEEVEVRSHFGPKRYRWQETQSVEESWRECHLHARNLLGAEGYAKLLLELSDSPTASDSSSATDNTANVRFPSNLSIPGVALDTGIQGIDGGGRSSHPGVDKNRSKAANETRTPTQTPPPAPFDPDTFTLSNDPPPARKKRR